jgi:hypothetical protein
LVLANETRPDGSQQHDVGWSWNRCPHDRWPGFNPLPGRADRTVVDITAARQVAERGWQPRPDSDTPEPQAPSTQLGQANESPMTPDAAEGPPPRRGGRSQERRSVLLGGGRVATEVTSCGVHLTLLDGRGRRGDERDGPTASHCPWPRPVHPHPVMSRTVLRARHNQRGGGCQARLEWPHWVTPRHAEWSGRKVTNNRLHRASTGGDGGRAGPGTGCQRPGGPRPTISSTCRGVGGCLSRSAVGVLDHRKNPQRDPLLSPGLTRHSAPVGLATGPGQRRAVRIGDEHRGKLPRCKMSLWDSRVGVDGDLWPPRRSPGPPSSLEMTIGASSISHGVRLRRAQLLQGERGGKDPVI